MFRILSLALFLTGAAVAASAADVYRYVDAQGGVHYTDTWVPGSTLIKVDHHVKAAEAAPTPTRTAQSKALSAANDNASAQIAKQADEQAVHADVAQSREQQCKDATENYNKAVASRRIIKTGPDGSRDYLSETDADAYRVQLRTEMQSACGTASK